jgi:hypothetical protein
MFRLITERLVHFGSVSSPTSSSSNQLSMQAFPGKIPSPRALALAMACQKLVSIV